MSSSSSSSSSRSPRFRMGPWYRWLPFLGYHHVLMILMSINIILWCFLLAGSSSSGSMTGIYLLGLSYKPDSLPSSNGKLSNPAIQSTLSDTIHNTTGLIQTIQVGYMSLCVKLASGTWLCDSHGRTLTDLVRNSPSMDPLNLVWVADRYRREATFLPFAFLVVITSLMAIIFMSTFPAWHEEEEDEDASTRQIKLFPSRSVSHAACATAGITSILTFISTFWVHMGGAVAITLVKSLTYGAAEAHVNATALVLAWLGVIAAITTTMGLVIMISSIKALTQLAR